MFHLEKLQLKGPPTTGVVMIVLLELQLMALLLAQVPGVCNGMTHTNGGEYYPWWRVNLGSAYQISKIVIANGYDNCMCGEFIECYVKSL